MNDLRAAALQQRIEAWKDANKSKRMSKQQAKVIEDDCQNIHLTKFDDTIDFRGCLYNEKPHKLRGDLCKLLGFVNAKGYKTSRSCIQFFADKSGIDRFKLYCKDLHLI